MLLGIFNVDFLSCNFVMSGLFSLTGVACTLSYFQDVLGIISCKFDLTNDDLCYYAFLPVFIA